MAALAAAAVMLAFSPAFADDSTGGSKTDSGTMMATTPARFGGSVYTNNPKLTNTLSMIVAGGGPNNFSTVTLFGVLADGKAAAEQAKLEKQFTKDKFAQFIKTFDFVMADSLKLVTAANVKLPAAPDPDPKDGKALAAALYQDGVDAKSGAYNVEYMLDHLVTHPVHVAVMKDIDAKYGVQADADYHIILLQIMKDLKEVYGL